MVKPVNHVVNTVGEIIIILDSMIMSLPTSSKLGQSYGNRKIISAHRGRSSW